MNELVTQQRAAQIALKSQSADLVEIRRDSTTFPRIKSYDTFTLLLEMKALILMVYQYRGQKPENANEIEMMARSLCAELLAADFGDDCKELTIEEIRRALRKSALGKGKEMYGINVKSLYDAIADSRNGDIETARQQVLSERKQEQKSGYMTIERVIECYAESMDRANKERLL